MSYEFNHSENAVIERTANLARTWAIVSLVLGVFGLLGGLSTLSMSTVLGVMQLIDAVVFIVVGVIFLQAGGALKSVVDTAGDDVAHMMGAMNKLGTAFLVQLIAVAVGFVLGMILGFSGAF